MEEYKVNRLNYIKYSEELKQEFMKTVPYYSNKVWEVKDELHDKYTTYNLTSEIFGEYVDAVKCFILLHIEADFSRFVIYNKVLALKWLFTSTDYKTVTFDDVADSKVSAETIAVAIRDFMIFAGIENPSFIKQCEGLRPFGGKARDVVNFDTMYKLDDIITNFYNTADEDALKYYFPIIIWWKVGCVIPLRSSEATFIKKGSISYSHLTGMYSMSIPDIKSVNQTTPNYSVLAISDDIAKAIQRYEELVSEDREYLFSNAVFCTRHRRNPRGISKDYKTRITREDLQTILSDFYNEVVSEVYEIVPKGTKAGHGEIELIQLGDLRHYALYNLVASGLDPYTIMKFARHSSINAQTHYVGHVYNMCLSKIEILSEKIKHLSDDNIAIHQADDMDVFSNREIQLLNIERECNDEGKRTPVEGGFCMNDLNCLGDCDCLVCPYFLPDREDTNAQAILDSRYTEELGRLSDVCEAMKVAYVDEHDYARMPPMAREREFIINKAVALRVKGANDGKTK